MALQFTASTDQITGGGWGGTVATIGLWWYIDTDIDASQDPWAVYSGAAGAGTLRGLLGTDTDGTTMLAYDSAFLSQAAGTPGVGTWYCTYVVMNNTTWNVYHGTDPTALAAVGPNTRTAISSPGSIVLSLSVEWFRGRIASLKMWTRALTAAECAAEASAYRVDDPTNLVRNHSFRTLSMTNEAGTGGNLTAGATSATLVAGPAQLDDLSPPPRMRPGNRLRCLLPR